MSDLNNRPLSQESDHARPWYYFDSSYYVSQSVDRGLSPPLGSEAAYLRHYLDRGASFGLSPNPLFDEIFYRRRYPDIAREIEIGRWKSGFEHFQRVGAVNGFSPTWFFDGVFYQAANPGLTEASLRFYGFSDLYSHYLLEGISEQRPAHWIVQALKTIKLTFDFPTSLNELCEFVTDGNALPSVFKPVFDFEWMKEKYLWGKSVRQGNFIRHYLLHVKSEELSPSPYFSESFYLSSEDGIRVAVDKGDFVCGYEHFLQFGMNERRRPFAEFDPNYYVYANMSRDSRDQPSLEPPFIHFLRNRGTRRLAISAPLADQDIPEVIGKGLYERRCGLNAARLAKLAFKQTTNQPDVSILIIARDNYEQTANCIVSAVFNTTASLEVIVFDNGSTDRTRDLPTINEHIKYIRAETNLGFTIAVNRAAEIATGRMILLLNNDVELTPAAIDNALTTLQSDRTIGAVGAKIVRMHGRLQEAGSIVWRDGSCLGYGRDKDPMDGQVNFLHDVDFCSGCFLGIMRSTWEEIGGFDEAYAPAYYEETDLCLRVWERGQRVVYDPRVTIWHFEFGSSSISEEPLALMRRNQRYFASKHKAFLSKCLAPSHANVERARLRHATGLHTLFIEDFVPDPKVGMGFTRSATVASVLEQACGFVSILGLHNSQWPTELAGDEAGRRVEVLTGINNDNVLEFFRSRAGLYDVVWLSRTHNLPRLQAWRSACPEFFANTRVIIDTEAIAATRRYAYARQARQPADLAAMVSEELDHLDGINHICVVNEIDQGLIQDMLEERGLAIESSILGHSVSVRNERPTFATSTDIVLFGAFSEIDSPNVDGLLWFDREIRPLIPELDGLRFVIAGSKAARFAASTALQHDYHIIDSPQDMGTVFAVARLVIAPTRFAAGMPMKVHDAASYGVPVVMTELLADQLGWRQDGICYSIAESAEMAAAIQNLALDLSTWHRAQALQLALIAEQCDPIDFARHVRQIVSDSGYEKVISIEHFREGAENRNVV